MVEKLYVAGAGSWLPERMSLGDAVAQGLVERALVWNTGIESVCVSTGMAPPEMAVRAARTAIGASDHEPDEFALVLHACAYHQGHDMWSPASYIQRFALGNVCPAMEVRQMSNGGLAAVELAAAYLTAHHGTAALVTTADRFSLPGFDRWRTDPATICGDGASAIVLSRRRGFALIRSLVTVSDPGLERGGRGDRQFGDAPLSAGTPIDMTANSGALVKEIGLEALLRRLEAGQWEAFDRACTAAGLKFSDIDRYVLPNLGRTRMKAQFFEPFGIDPARTTWDWGRTVGHLGAGDALAGFAELTSAGMLAPGQTCLLAGLGAGFSWTVAILEITADVRG
ncbi:ketoacyl-ACP synthase III family protein [Nocardia nova]|uniref:ketoacyl-ACP synthase III family protein n=1 Tax=Nocardia nova TaxID=37330 RepID=UPI0033EFEAE2